jgi:glycosyltransferase involved in cell wall biosynthesis
MFFAFAPIIPPEDLVGCRNRARLWWSRSVFDGLRHLCKPTACTRSKQILPHSVLKGKSLPLRRWWYNLGVMKRQGTIHVGLNAHLLSQQSGYRSGGIHNYIRQLIHHLAHADPSLQVTVFTGRGWQSKTEAQGALAWQASRWPTERPAVRIAWEQLAQPATLYRAKVDLVHALAFVSPLTTWIPTVVTIHDLSFMRFPDRFRAANRLYLTTMTRLSCRRARRIIAVSQATADETIRLLDVPAERIDVVHHGVEHSRFRPLSSDQVQAFRRDKDLPDRFVLFLGTLEPRKNLVTLVESFAHTRAARQGLRLVVAGGKGWYYQEIFRRVEDLGMTEAVRFPGFVPDAELPLWYNAATVFVYPSVYEGFGMPLLEAMACGCPVIGSNASCMPEVVGDAGLLVAPDDVAGLSAKLDLLLENADLREDLGRRGRTRAAAFTWEAAARATTASYRRALGMVSDGDQG